MAATALCWLVRAARLVSISSMGTSVAEGSSNAAATASLLAEAPAPPPPPPPSPAAYGGAAAEHEEQRVGHAVEQLGLAEQVEGLAICALSAVKPSRSCGPLEGA